jgi:hypothetical protein
MCWRAKSNALPSIIEHTIQHWTGTNEITDLKCGKCYGIVQGSSKVQDIIKEESDGRTEKMVTTQDEWKLIRLNLVAKASYTENPDYERAK